jgi:hypothetical protein
MTESRSEREGRAGVAADLEGKVLDSLIRTVGLNSLFPERTSWQPDAHPADLVATSNCSEFCGFGARV